MTASLLIYIQAFLFQRIQAFLSEILRSSACVHCKHTIHFVLDIRHYTDLLTTLRHGYLLLYVCFLL